MSVSTLNPKVAQEAKSTTSSSNSTEEQSGKREPSILTQTEQALRFFSSRAEQIPGVIKICRYPVERANEEGVRVIVTDLFSPITHEVIRVQELTYDTMPGIRFHLDIKDASTAERIEK